MTATYGTRGNDTLTGTAGNDQLYGENGNDVLAPGSEASGTTLTQDVLNGGMGFDAVDYSGDTPPDPDAGLIADLGAGTAWIPNSFNDLHPYKRRDTLVSIEHIIGTSGNDDLTAGTLPSFSAPDTVKSRSTTNGSIGTAVDLDHTFRIKSDPTVANSATIPHASVDAVSAGESEYYAMSVVAPGDAVTIGVAGATSSFTPFVVIYDSNSDVLAMQSSTSPCTTLNYTFQTTGEYYIRVSGSAVDASGNRVAIPAGTAYTLQVSQTAVRDYWLEGGAGGDFLTAGTGFEKLDGGAGNDEVSFQTLGSGVTANLATGSAYGAQGSYGLVSIESAIGSNYDDVLTGSSSGGQLEGEGGNDTLRDNGGATELVGGDGDDTYYVSNANSSVFESANGGTDTVYSSVSVSVTSIEHLVLTGSANINANDGSTDPTVIAGNSGANRLYGGAASDTIYGGAGDDTIDGGAGNDILYGQDGKDVFLFDTALGTGNVDIISGFTVGQDLIELDRTIFAAIAADGTLPASAFAIGAAATSDSTRIVYNSATGDLYYDQDGSGAAAQRKFAHVAAGTALTASSFTAVR